VLALIVVLAATLEIRTAITITLTFIVPALGLDKVQSGNDYQTSFEECHVEEFW